MKLNQRPLLESKLVMHLEQEYNTFSSIDHPHVIRVYHFSARAKLIKRNKHPP